MSRTGPRPKMPPKPRGRPKPPWLAPDELTMLQGIVARQLESTDAIEAMAAKYDAEASEGKEWAAARVKLIRRLGDQAWWQKIHNYLGPVMVVQEGKRKRMTRGFRRRDAAGRSVHVQLSLLDATFAELRAKAQEEVSIRDAHDETARILLALVDLETLCPGATTAREAAKRLGLDLAKYLTTRLEAEVRIA